MITVQLLRYVARGDGVFGQLIAPKFHCFTVERPWLQNAPNISCVPAGIYPLVLEYSDKFARPLWELKEVPGRNEAKIHIANRASDLEGCIGPGQAIAQDAQGWFVTQSAETLKAFHAAMGEAREGRIVITDVPGPATKLVAVASGVGPE